MLSSLVQRAQSIIEQSPLISSNDRHPSKAALFREQFRLPESQHPVAEISAELFVPLPYSSSTGVQPPTVGEKAKDNGTRYLGELHLSESFLCFSTLRTSFLPSATHASSTSYTGQTGGAGPGGHGFTIPLCSIRRVERLNSAPHVFNLALTVWDKYAQQQATTVSEKPSSALPVRKLILNLEGSRQGAERFCDYLKKCLRESMRELDGLRTTTAECYSEYLMNPLVLHSKASRDPDKTLPEPPDVGLGAIFRYPGDARKLRDRSKIRLWTDYMRENGRNVTLVRQPTFHKLIRVGLPNRLRGELWEISSGSFYTRLRNPNLYQKTLDKFVGKESLAIDEIEKDLNRSLPEYAGYQDERGIERLRRVLTAYSWTNEEVGYCQAMNIVVAAILIYTSEPQAFFLLSALCDRFVPGYYSKDMYGTLLDQKVFESLVEKTMPVLWEHLVKSDVNLSVVSLPWFLSLYINSMPLVFAFRVLDVFFLEGPKVLFQIGLAILRINGEELLDVTDDGSFISILKNYFARLDESAHPTSQNEKLRAITRFQELMVTAFKEFGAITHSTVTELREKHIDNVKEGLATFAKRTSIRNLGPESKKLSTEDLSTLYDRFFSILRQRQDRAKAKDEERRKSELQNRRPGVRSLNSHNASDAPLSGNSPLQTMDYDAFREFLANTAKWAMTDSPTASNNELSTQNGSIRARSKSVMNVWGAGPEPADHDFMQRLYGKWDESKQGALNLQNIVNGMARLKGTTDIMNSMSLFFDLFDDDENGKVDREGILRMSESLLFLSRRGFDGAITDPDSSNGTASAPPADLSPGLSGMKMTVNEKFLSSVSAFIRRCFEYADPDKPEEEVHEKVTDLHLSATPTDDLLDLTETPSHTKPITSPRSTSTDPLSSNSPLLTANSSMDMTRRNSTRAVSSNVALDPNKPLHITLPTFRMVILADELLEQFFETFFPQSFRLASSANGSELNSSSSTSTLSGNLTTFANIGQPVRNLASNFGSRKEAVPDVGLAGGVVEPGSRGIRGVLDNIVNDGMRMAAEMRKRMDEAQREFERQQQDAIRSGRKNTAGTEDDDEDDEDDDLHARRADRDLLEGAEASSIRTSKSEASIRSGSTGGSGDVSEMLGSDMTGFRSKGKDVDRSVIGTSLMDEPVQLSADQKSKIEFEQKFALE
ncbi:GTPase activating protein (GAP) [Lithohypha guttulata]|uniref:GTPase activating protein (GAP) n=1 Tax=Lithohypha guttulata TaxID=1690604 RepID=UPI002DDE6954|nr:GTPase activating protein (GAP) [Lithohypha guttulata]